MSQPAGDLDFWNAEAVIFDMDGVVTDTATVHIEAWRKLFDDYLGSNEAARSDDSHRRFTDDDYRRFVDGRARIDGVSEFLGSRGIDLPMGASSDDPTTPTRWGLASRKNELFLEQVERDGVRAFATTLDLIRRLREARVAVAVVTASRNASHILAAAGADDLFEVRVDGLVAAELALPGKPDPATFLEAARRLHVAPELAVVVEDAISGVQAGARGGFGLVVGVDRTGHAEALAEAGADLVVSDLGELL